MRKEGEKLDRETVQEKEQKMIVLIIAGIMLVTGIAIIWLEESEILRFESAYWLLMIILALPIHIAVIASGMECAVYFARHDALIRSIYLFFSTFVYITMLVIVFYRANRTVYHPVSSRMDLVYVNEKKAKRILLLDGISIFLYQVCGIFYLIAHLLPVFKNPFSNVVCKIVDQYFKGGYHNIVESTVGKGTSPVTEAYPTILWILGIICSIFFTIHAIIRIFRSTPLVVEKTMIQLCIMLWIPGINLIAVVFIFQKLSMIKKSYRKARER